MIRDNSRKAITISTGKSRQATTWTNRTITWGELVERLKRNVVTKETVEEYKLMNHDEQSAIKDVGGFVGGKLKDCLRRTGTVEWRDVLSLDVDHASPEFLNELVEGWDIMVGVEVFIYSTHKHTPEAPRFRLIVPLSRKVNEREYEPLARAFAFALGIEYFDDTTYQATRLMFWPSSSKDGEVIALHFEGTLTSPDDYLKHVNIDDKKNWPRSSRENYVPERDTSSVQDPTTKEGIVGAFCRIYGIEEAINEFLSNVYTESNMANRYTYINGSTSGGLVVYDNKFAYSNHESDPAGGQLCNAFDLVRIHLFHMRDKNGKGENLPATQKPSFKAMVKFLKDNTNVQKDLAESLKEKEKERVKEAIGEDAEWLDNLEKEHGQYGPILPTIENFKTIMRHDPLFRGAIGYDEFKGRIAKIGKPRWPGGINWDDSDDSVIRNHIEHVYKLYSPNKTSDAIGIVAQEKRFNPVKDFISKVEWDGKPRVERLLIDYLGADDSAYVRTITRKVLTAAVKRIYEPGCKFDWMLTIMGEQGCGKSLLINKIGNGWASDSMPDLRSQKAYEALDGVWIMEVGELVALKKVEVETIKNFISKQEDTYRKAYAHHVTENPRTCIFIGTTNEHDFLSDPTGARRFPVVKIDPKKRTKTVWDDLSKEEIHQLWAEALELYRAGEDINSLPEEIQQEAVRIQEEHTNRSEKQGLLEDYLEIPLPETWYEWGMQERRDYIQGTEEFRKSRLLLGDIELSTFKRDRISTAEVANEFMCIEPKLQTKPQSYEISGILRQMKWVPIGSRKDKTYGSQKTFKRPE